MVGVRGTVCGGDEGASGNIKTTTEAVKAYKNMQSLIYGRFTALPRELPTGFNVIFKVTNCLK